MPESSAAWIVAMHSARCCGISDIRMHPNPIAGMRGAFAPRRLVGIAIYFPLGATATRRMITSAEGRISTAVATLTVQALVELRVVCREHTEQILEIESSNILVAARSHLVYPVRVPDARTADGDQVEFLPVETADQFRNAGDYGGRIRRIDSLERLENFVLPPNAAHRQNGSIRQRLRPACQAQLAIRPLRRVKAARRSMEDIHPCRTQFSEHHAELGGRIYDFRRVVIRLLP